MFLRHTLAAKDAVCAEIVQTAGLNDFLVMHVIAFFDTVESRRNDQTEIQENQRHAHKTLRGRVHGVGDEFAKHGQAPFLILVHCLPCVKCQGEKACLSGTPGLERNIAGRNQASVVEVS